MLYSILKDKGIVLYCVTPKCSSSTFYPENFPVGFLKEEGTVCLQCGLPLRKINISKEKYWILCEREDGSYAYRTYGPYDTEEEANRQIERFNIEDKLMQEIIRADFQRANNDR